MRLQVLLSIMNDSNPIKKIEKMNIKCNYVIVNQVLNKKIKLTNDSYKNSKIISVNDRGLSKSRNLALKNSTDEILLFSDDDMSYVDDLESKIISAYEKYDDADAIAFIVKNINRKIKYKVSKINFFQSLKISSVQLTVKSSSIKNNNILFDENFGSGSKYFMGEENIFLSDCLRKKMKIYFVPIEIGELHFLNNSKWFKGYNYEYFLSKGAVFYRISNLIYPLLILLFAFRKKSLYINNVTTLNAIKYMFNGVKDYKEYIKNEKNILDR